MTEFQNCYVIQWGIENFSMCTQKSGDSLVSRSFSEESSQNQTWSVKLYPRGLNDANFISIELCAKEQVSGVFSVIVSLIDGGGFPCFSKEISTTFYSQTGCFRISDFIERDELFANKLSILPNDTLTLQCIIRKPFKLHYVMQSVKFEKSSFTWPIENFSAIKPNAGDLTYPLAVNFDKAPRLDLEFCLEENSSGESEVCIRFKKINKYQERYFKALRTNPVVDAQPRVEYLDCPIFISFEIFSVRSNRSTINLFHGDHFFPNIVSDETYSLPRMKTSELFNGESGMLTKDTLFLLVNLRLSDGSCLPQQSYTESEYFQPHESLHAFHKSLCEKLYEEKEFCDVVLKVGNESLSAHKAVLHSLSPVFRAMLESDMAEKNTGIIDIVDFDADTMKCLLRLLYTGNVDKKLPCENILKLYAAAHKYQVSFLAAISSSLRMSMITMENVWEVMSCAFKYDDAVLKDAAKSFISKHMSKSLDMFTIMDDANSQS